MAKIIALRSSEGAPFSVELERLSQIFSHLHAPYSAEDVRAFSSFYSSIYRDLSPHERLYAEGMVDLMIAGLEKKEYSTLIYGVV